MLPTPRLLWLLLFGALLIAVSTWAPFLLWLAIVELVFVGGLLITDVIITPRPTQIEVERIHDQRLSLGAENRITILLSNRSARDLCMTVRDEYPYTFPCDNVFLRGTLRAYDIWEATYHVRPLLRGDYRFGKVNLRYESVLRFFIRQASYPAQSEVKVYPNVLDIRKYDLLARKGLLSELGLRRTRTLGTGTEFERMRDYTTDDEFRRINWKATARRNKPIAAEYETERSQYIVTLIDTGRLMRPHIGELAKLDYVINSTLLFSYVALNKGDHVGVLTFGDQPETWLAPQRGHAQFSRMLELLYNVQLQPVEADYARAISFLSARHRRRSLVLLFTDLVTLDATKPLIAWLGRLARRHVPLCVTISDPNITRYAGQPVENSPQTYERAVAEMLIDERRTVLDTLNRNGVLTLDVPADKLTASVINTYLALKSRGTL